MHWLVTSFAWTAAVALSLAWLWGSRQTAVERTWRRTVSISLRLLLIFAVLHWAGSFLSWQSYAILAAVFLLLFNVVPLWMRAPMTGDLPDVIFVLLYPIEQWALGWPDRRLWIPPNPSANSKWSEHDSLIGQAGVALTALRPVGRVRVGEHEFEARSEGTFIDPGTPVCVVRTDGFSLVVASNSQPA